MNCVFGLGHVLAQLVKPAVDIVTAITRYRCIIDIDCYPYSLSIYLDIGPR